MSANLQAKQYLYLASIGGETITSYALDDETGKLTQQSELSLPGKGGAMCYSANRELIYAAVTGLKEDKAGVVTIERGEGGSLKILGVATITSRAPYIRASDDGQCLLAAHYGNGDVTVYRITKGICTSELLDQKTTEKTAHCIELDPSGRFAFVPHTSPNKVYQFILDTTRGKLKPHDPPFVAGPDTEHRYHEPRHIAFHPSLKLAYTSNENGGGISRWEFDPEQGSLRLTTTLCTLPLDYEGASAAADIRITPNGRFAYVSNRDTRRVEPGDPTKDTIAAVRLDSTSGKMEIVGHYATCHFPRTMCTDLQGRYLYAAGQKSDTLIAYRIDQTTGALSQVESYPTKKTPIWAMVGE